MPVSAEQGCLVGMVRKVSGDCTDVSKALPVSCACHHNIISIFLVTYQHPIANKDTKQKYSNEESDFDTTLVKTNFDILTKGISCPIAEW